MKDPNEEKHPSPEEPSKEKCKKCEEKAKEKAIIERLRAEQKNNPKRRKEILEMVKMTFRDHEGRRQHHWGMLYRSVLAIVTVMAIPYFLSRDSGESGWKDYRIVFPIISFLLCFISMAIHTSLNKRQKDVLKDMLILIQSMSEDYRSTHLSRQGNYYRVFSVSVETWVHMTYALLMASSVLEIIFIQKGII